MGGPFLDVSGGWLAGCFATYGIGVTGHGLDCVYLLLTFRRLLEVTRSHRRSPRHRRVPENYETISSSSDANNSRFPPPPTSRTGMHSPPASPIARRGEHRRWPHSRRRRSSTCPGQPISSRRLTAAAAAHNSKSHKSNHSVSKTPPHMVSFNYGVLLWFESSGRGVDFELVLHPLCRWD